MPQPQAAGAARPTSSARQVLSEAEGLAGPFEACRPEYAAMLASVGLGTGWHVLDAGCGSGSHLPLLAGHLGPGGRLTAIDLPAADRRARERLHDADAPDHPVDHPAFYACEGQTVAVGVVVAPQA